MCVFGVPGDAVEGVAVELSAHVSHTSLLKPFIPDSSPPAQPAQPAQRSLPHPTRLHPFPSPVSLRCSHCSRPHPSSPRVLPPSSSRGTCVIKISSSLLKHLLCFVTNTPTPPRATLKLPPPFQRPPEVRQALPGPTRHHPVYSPRSSSSFVPTVSPKGALCVSPASRCAPYPGCLGRPRRLRRPLPRYVHEPQWLGEWASRRAPSASARPGQLASWAPRTDMSLN